MMTNLAIETEKLDRIYKIRGKRKEKNIRKALVALQDVNLQVWQVARAFPTLASFSDLQLIGIRSGFTVLFAQISIFIFRFCDYRAHESGLIDRVSNY